MATLIPVTQPPNVEAAYEDMFKEITRKLYGEETGNGLHTLGTPVAHIATTGPTAPEGERSFTTLMSDRTLTTTIEYDQNGTTEPTTANNFKTEDHLTTAFGLAALMQNGFPTTGTILNAQTLTKGNAHATTAATTSASNTINVVANTAAVIAAENSDQQQRWATTTEEIITWPANSGGKLAAFNGSQKITKPIKNRIITEPNDVYHGTANAATTVVVQTNNNPTPNNRKNKNSNSHQNQTTNNNNNNNNNNGQIQIQKRYACTHCPYSTDRRDLYTRHENIHKEEKPFQCYACLKQFNRADHVKKHFLRMHRELTYDINKTRRTIVTEQKPVIFTQRNNNNQQQQQPTQQHQSQQIVNSFITTQRTTAALQDSVAAAATLSSIAQTIESVATAQIAQHPQHLKQEKTGDDKSLVKIKREKRFSCCYCPWTGADKWGLKRHLNTHTKPFVCMLCDYKAARSERLATHVLKVHNKKACNKCSFLAENQEEYQAHMNEVHPHDQRPARNNNSNSNNNNTSNVLRTIGNTLVTTNNQINNFQNPTTSFGTIQTTTGGVAIYTTNDPTGNANGTNGIQEIIVNPTSMVGWRLSANGSLIPPSHLTEQAVTGVLTTSNSNQKRGAERLFQYLEADGSDTEDYTRQLKMDAISRNTASVAQDFHNAGGVVQSRNFISSNNNKADPYEAMKFIKSEFQRNASMLQFNNINRNEKFGNANNHYGIVSTASTNASSNVLLDSRKRDQRQAMSSFYDNQDDDQHLKSPPAYNNNNNKSARFDSNRKTTVTSSFKGHRLNFLTQQDKENSNSIFSNMEYESNSASAQFQNYVKEIINKYYAETPLLCTEPNIRPSIHAITNRLSNRLRESPSANNSNNRKSPTARPIDETKMDEETRNYFQYLSQKKDITITFANGEPALRTLRFGDSSSPNSVLNNTSNSDKRKRKQSQPKKITRPDILTILRDKYLKRLVDPRLSCRKCANSPQGHNMILFPYHTRGSLTLHRIWRHSSTTRQCRRCTRTFSRDYSYKIHMVVKHKTKARKLQVRRNVSKGQI